MTVKECLICGREANYSSAIKESNGEIRREVFVECPHCGSYIIPNSSMLFLVFGENTERDKYYVSCYLNETKPEHDSYHPIQLSSEVLKSIIRQVPKTVEEKVDKLLQFVNKNTSYFGDTVEVTDEVIYSQEGDELYNIVDALSERGLLDDSTATDGSESVSLTLNGVEAIKNKRETTTKDKCFVAMWFNDEMNKVYDDIIVPACMDAGYQPVRVDRELYNGDITDKIISSIRTTAFTIADFSGNRGGVYYEAGFAKGLGKEVIMTCQEEWFNGKEEGKKVHFDVNHINMIVWNMSKLNEFRENLTNRIVATIGKGSFNMIFQKTT